MPKVFTSETQKIGELGEDIASRYLQNKGFEIIERNYTRKWGEIDIVAQKGDKIYFIEVKSVTRDDLEILDRHGGYRPEDNMHPWKLKRLSRTIQTYLLNKKDGSDDWQFDLLCVFLNMESRKARVRKIENIIL